MPIIFIIAVFIRLFLMAFTYHPDLSGQALSCYFFSYENVANIYDHLANLAPNHPLVRNFGVQDIFIYPPLTYFTLGFFQKIIAVFFDLKGFLLQVMNGTNIYSIPNLPLFLFLLKLPYLFFDLATAFLIGKFFTDKKSQRLAIIFWFFNPVTLYATFAMGVFDIIPTFFTLLSLYFLKKNRYLPSALALGIGIAFKSYPIFLLPIVVLFSSPKFWTRLKVAAIGLLPIVLTNLPYITSSAYRYMVFSPKSQKMLYMEWMLTGAEGLYPFIILTVLLYLFISKTKFVAANLNRFYLASFLILFSLTHYHPQWFIWITPFIILDLVINKFADKWLYLILFSIYVFIVLTFENSLSVGLFAVLDPQLNKFPGISVLLASKFDINSLKSMARSVFAAISIYLTTKDSIVK